MILRAAIVTPLTPTAASLRMETSSEAGPCAAIRRLTSGLAAGEEAAFREFHDAYFDRLLRYLLVVTRGDEEAARDALQETFVRVVRHARRFDSGEAFWSWLTVLARSAATDLARKRNRYWRLLTSYAAAWGPAFSAEAQDDGDEALQAMLQHGLAGLGAEDRVLIEGKYLRRMSVRDLAAQSGLTERAVESRLVRARRELREQLLTHLKNERSR